MKTILIALWLTMLLLTTWVFAQLTVEWDMLSALGLLALNALVWFVVYVVGFEVINHE